MSAAEHRLALVKLVELFFEGPHQNHLAQHLFSLRRIEHQLLRDLYLRGVCVQNILKVFSVVVIWARASCQGEAGTASTSNFHRRGFSQKKAPGVSPALLLDR
jgi:hypothetical protein